MLTGNALCVWKQRMLTSLAAYNGIAARESQLITDAQYTHGPDARPDDIRQALAALKDDGYATRISDGIRGITWKITPEGNQTAAKIALEDSGD